MSVEGMTRIGGWAGWLLWLSVVGSSPVQAANKEIRNVAPAPFDAVVMRVVDGDTVWVQAAENRRARWIKVRLQGIDAPEICQAGGPGSRDVLSRRIMDQRVRVAPSGRDDYGRLLARLAMAGPGEGRDDVGGWMVTNGQAWSYRFRWNPGPYASEQHRAKAVRRGLFSDAAAEEPREFRKRHGPCALP